MQGSRKCSGINLLFAGFLMSTFLAAVNEIAHARPEVARILFESNRSYGKNTDIYAMDADGANVERLTHHPRPNLSPTWSPDGTQFAMATIPVGWFEHIYVLIPFRLNISVYDVLIASFSFSVGGASCPALKHLNSRCLCNVHLEKWH